MTIRQDIILYLQVASKAVVFRDMNEMKDYLEGAISDARLGAKSEGNRKAFVAFGDYLSGLTTRSYIDLWAKVWGSIEEDRARREQMERYAQECADVDIPHMLQTRGL